MYSFLLARDAESTSPAAATYHAPDPFPTMQGSSDDGLSPSGGQTVGHMPNWLAAYNLHTPVHVWRRYKAHPRDSKLKSSCHSQRKTAYYERSS